SDFQKYQSTSKTIFKDTRLYKNATKDVKNQKKLIASTKKKIAIVTKQYAKASGSKKVALKKQLDNLKRVYAEQRSALTKLKKKHSTAKSRLSKAQSKSLAAEKATQRAILKKAIAAAVMAETGGKDVTWITPVNPGSKESYAILWPDSEDFSSSVN
ncbi:hypothetical protein GKC44_14485, partial [Lactobacillus parabuchneri]|nr:hypothetical protein [Lentilactobacillus parabuchneri]